MSAEPFIRLEALSRSFGRTRALRDVSIDLAHPGEIHALVGENGAGKSTCLGLVSGRIAPSSGRVLVEGRELEFGSPQAAKQAGIHTIYQELTIVPALSPEANVFLGQSRARGGWLKEQEMRTAYHELCERMGVQPARVKRCGDLSIADQQLVEIMRALVSTAKAILLDEPTAALAENERTALFDTLHGLRRRGIALVLVSHNLDEVLTHSQTISVFRDGQLAEQRRTEHWSKRGLVTAMLGGTNPAAARGLDRSVIDTSPQDALMRVRGLSSDQIQGVEFDLRPGEILGIAGLVGSGRTELLRALAGLDPHATGTVEVGGSDRVPTTVREARRRGIALLPEDRKGQGLVLSLSAADNIALGEWTGIARRSTLSSPRVRAAVTESARAVGFDTTRLGERTRNFSGGNQQKLLLARWLHTDHRVLLADEPTRGVDVGAKAEILAALERLVGAERSLIVVSSELEEVIEISARVLVLHDGRAVALLDASGGDITVERVLGLIFESDESTPPMMRELT